MENQEAHQKFGNGKRVSLMRRRVWSYITWYKVVKSQKIIGEIKKKLSQFFQEFFHVYWESSLGSDVLTSESMDILVRPETTTLLELKKNQVLHATILCYQKSIIDNFF